MLLDELSGFQDTEGLTRIGMDKFSVEGLKESDEDEPGVDEKLDVAIACLLGYAVKVEVTFPGFKNNLYSPSEAIDLQGCGCIPNILPYIGEEDVPAKELELLLFGIKPSVSFFVSKELSSPYLSHSFRHWGGNESER